MGSSLFDLSGEIVVLTGATGLVGRALARDLVGAGVKLVIASRDADRCGKLAQSLADGRGTAYPLAFDQGSVASIRLLRDQVIGRFGRIDGLINNAVVRPDPANRDSAECWEDSMRVNATGMFLMHELFSETMACAGRGSIVNMGSIQGIVGPTPSLYDGKLARMGPSDYFFHKAGLEGLTRYYAATMGPKGVRVNYVAPGGVLNGQPSDFVRNYSAKTYLGRMAAASELSGVVIFLLSRASSYVTGASIAVDGGYTAH